jgi:phage terminase large subunit-like protein
MDLQFDLHAGQLEVFNDPKRFKVVVAGRRWGKSRLACITLLVEALKSTNQYGYDLAGRDVYYIAPTFEQAKRIMWSLIKRLGHSVIASVHENTGAITLINGRKIELKGADRPDTLRGVGLGYVVLDEMADMKPEVWEQIIRPALADVKGGALFIGTPKGKNHFYSLTEEADKDKEDWAVYSYKSIENPTLDSKEVEAARKSMSTDIFRQEFEASFASGGSGLFKEEWIKYDEKEPREGSFYIAVDLAGYAEESGQTKSKLKRLDETAIAIVKVHSGGWWVKEVRTGRWGVRETAVQIIKAARDVHAICTGIEKGALMNAVMPYIEDTKRRIGVYPHIVPLTHGGKSKNDRVVWSLQGRFEHGKVKLNKGEWTKQFVEQLLDFPNPLAHDDMVDSLSYIDQIAITTYETIEVEEWEPMDERAGI